MARISEIEKAEQYRLIKKEVKRITAELRRKHKVRNVAPEAYKITAVNMGTTVNRVKRAVNSKY